MFFIAHLLTHSSFLFLSILTVFLSREWKHLTNESIIVRQKRRLSWLRPSGTMKKFRARLSIWLPPSKYATVSLIQPFYCWFNQVLSLHSLPSHSPWAGPVSCRNLRSIYQRWNWTASTITQRPTPSRIQQERSSPTRPVERWGLPRQIN